MAGLAPQGGIRRHQFLVLVGGVHTTATDVDIRVYKDHAVTPDATLSAEALGNLVESQTGVYRYSYSVAGIAAGTHLLDEIWVQPTGGDTLAIRDMDDAIVNGVLDQTLAVPNTDSVTLKLRSSSC